MSKYNPNWPVARNINLPPSLISRFDLLYLVLDRVDEALDRRLAQHLVGLYLEDIPTRSSQDTIVSRPYTFRNRLLTLISARRDSYRLHNLCTYQY